MSDIIPYAIYSYVVNKFNGMDEETAKGDALFLAHIIESRARRGWSGNAKGAGPQTIPSKVVVKDGVTRVYKAFGRKVMTGNAFDKGVVAVLGEVKFNQLLSRTRQEIRRGRDFSKVVSTLRSLI